MVNKINSRFNILMIQTIENFCLKHNLFIANEHLLIACSGGADSLALVDIFRQLASKYKFTISVAHAEHGIRKQSSLDDAQFVKAYCQKYHLPFYLKHLQVLKFAQEHKYSVETAARILRYNFLRETKKQIHATKILTAHHMNDQAETILQHLMRGSGAEGLKGMSIVNGDIIRPFLAITRKEIEAYCQEHKLTPRFDETNDSLDYERNRIRLELLPQMATYNPQIIKALCQTAQLIGQEHDFIKIYTRKIYANICQENLLAKNLSISLNIAPLLNEHKAIRYSLYRYILQKIQGNLANISLIHIDNIDKFLYNGHVGLILQLPANLKIYYQYGKLNFTKQAKNIFAQADYSLNIMAKINEPNYLPDGQIIEINSVDKIFPIKGRNHCFIDADKIKGNLLIRSRQNGDKIVPKGMQGSKKVKDIFIDNKIPAPKRAHVPIICDEQGIIWLAGVQQDIHYLVGKDSKHILYLKIY